MTMPTLRYEIKMTTAALHLPEVQSWVRLHQAAFFERYPPRRVSSLYFDTLEGECLDANLIGAHERRKLRLRWYGADFSAVQGILELKCKQGCLGWKDIFPLPDTLDLTRISWETLEQTLREQVTGPFAVWPAYFSRPMLLTRYWREYYESMDLQVRITIDSELQVYEQFMHLTPNLTAPAPLADVLVVEVKADGDLHRRVSDILSSFPMQVSRNSKYVNGVLETLGAL